MPDSIMYEQDAYVVIESDQPETFLTPDELLLKLKNQLATIQDDLPVDLQDITSVDEQAQVLMDTSCELNLGPDHFLQWYAVRLEK
ncbi:MAG: chlororespiratory reduction protein 7 [Cyanobacteria bacterium P01_F01_bin.42]